MNKTLQNKIFIRLIFLLLIIVQYNLLIVAQEVVTITENGNELILPRELRRKIASKNTEVRSVIVSWYTSSGYLNASLTEDPSGKYILEKGCRYSILELNIQEEKFSSLSKSNLGVYSESLLNSKIKDVLYELEEQGYIFAKVEIESLYQDSQACEVSINLSIDEREQWYSEEVLFPGAKSNKAEYLTKISGFRDSVLITPMVLNKLKLNLEQSELFEEVANPEVYLENERAIIVIPVQERTLNQFDGLLGYVPDQAGNGQIVGDFELSLWNVLNQGNGLNLEYQRLKPETTRLNIGASQDWFGSVPVGLGFNFSIYQNDTTYQTRNLNLESYYLVSPGLRLTGGVGQISSTSNNSTSLLREPDGKKRYAELGFRYSTLDNIDVPRSGIRFGVSFGLSKKRVEIDSLEAFSQQFIQSEASYFIPLSFKSILALSTHAFFLNAEKVTESDLIRFGGANSFRGYSEEQFGASYLLWGDVEYRFMVNRTSYLFAFGAVGEYRRPKLLTEFDDSFKTSNLLYSTGFGISYKVRIGRLKFTYAISPEESLGNGKVHIGIITKL